MAAVCERYGWTYEQYCDQPLLLLEVIALKMGVEAELAEEHRDRAEHGLK